MGTVDRGVKIERFFVLRNTDCPAVLVECAFISNSDDEALLASEQGKDGFARAIARGLIMWLDSLTARGKIILAVDIFALRMFGIFCL